PRRLDRAIATALAPEPSDRFDDARAFADALAIAPESDVEPARRGVVRTWFAVPIVVVVVAAIAIALGLSLGRLEVGGPLGIRAAEDHSASTSRTPVPLVASTTTIRPASASAYDPLGDGSENSSSVGAAID